MSIRLRLTIWYSAVLFAALALFGSGMWFTLRHRLLSGVDAALSQRIQGLRTVLEIENAAPEGGQPREELEEYAREVPDGELMQVRDASGRFLLPPGGQPDLPAVAPHAARYRTTFRGRGPLRILESSFDSGGRQYAALVAAPLAETEAALRNLRNLLFTMIPGFLAVACLGGYWISGRALQPVDRITAEAKTITVRNLSKRLPVQRTGDELQRLSEAWNEVLERLDSSIRRIRQFTADASHELRTPVALIRATAELALRRDRVPEDYRQALGEIAREAERMTELTESLLLLARADSNGLEMPVSPTDLGELVTEVVRQAGPIAAAKDISLTAETSASIAPANEAGIRRLLLILVDNAVKHTPQGGTVRVSTERRTGGVTLSVTDTGEGIDPDALPHIFERFYRADAARGSDSGAGLGLSIAQAIAQAHGSQITVESTPGAGARFSVTLRSRKN